MNTLVIVSDGNIILEKVIFSYYDVAMFFAERRRKQGYIVEVKTVK